MVLQHQAVESLIRPGILEDGNISSQKPIYPSVFRNFGDIKRELHKPGNNVTHQMSVRKSSF